MGEQYSKMELKQLAKFLRKVYPGVSDQDSLWALIEKTERLISKGKYGKHDSWRGDRA
jgi:hypothetical protein